MLTWMRWSSRAMTPVVLVLFSLILFGSGVSAQESASALAYDGRALFRETQATQATFSAVWGERAAARWIEEHNAALAGGSPLSGPRVVFFSSLTAAVATAPSGPVDAFVGGLLEQGFVPGQTIGIDWRFSEGHTDTLSSMAADIVASRPDVIVTEATQESIAARAATSSIPIVFAASSDPVGAGLVPSFDHPGGNVTGLTNSLPDVNARRLARLKGIVPNLTRVAVFRYTPNPATASALKESEDAGPKLGLEIIPVLITSLPDGLTAAFQAAVAANAQAVVLLPEGQFNVNVARIAELATAHRLPVLSQNRVNTQAGLLVSWGPGVGETPWRAAGYVAKILRGAKPSDLPVGIPYQMDLAINIKTAQAIGLSVPEPIIAQAALVIR
jgi:putative tryptophan/tyrosine transport system substrate-binding protein